MKSLHKPLLTFCFITVILASSISFGSSDAIFNKNYTLTYHNSSYPSSLLVNNGELYMNISSLKSVLGLNTTIDGTIIKISDANQMVTEMLDENDNLYTGELLNGKRHGDGVLYLHNGGKYDGEWANDLYDGTGTLVLANGNIYVGEFSKGFMHGQGKLFYLDGSYYKGSFYYGVIEGFGLYYVNNDNKYEGYWENGLRNGKGKAYIDGIYKKGLFENNQLIKTLPESSFDF